MTQRLISLLETADIHVQRIRQAIQEIETFEPITTETIERLTWEQVKPIELLISRFAKLQDILGAKIFPGILEAVGEDSKAMTMIDRLNRLEQLGVIDHVNLWQEMRNTRNMLTHEYPDHPEITADYLHKALEVIPYLIKCVESVRSFIDSRRL